MIIIEDLSLPCANTLLTHLIARNLSPALDMYLVSDTGAMKHPLHLDHCPNIVGKHNLRMHEYLNGIRVGSTAEMGHRFSKIAKEMFEDMRTREAHHQHTEARIRFGRQLNDFKALCTYELLGSLLTTYHHEIYRSQMIPNVYLCVERVVILDVGSPDVATPKFHYHECNILHDDVLDAGEVDAILKYSPKRTREELLWVVDTLIRYPMAS